MISLCNAYIYQFLIALELRKEHARSGLRKEIVQSDDEEDVKKNENGGGPASEENA